MSRVLPGCSRNPLDGSLSASGFRFEIAKTKRTTSVTMTSLDMLLTDDYKVEKTTITADIS